MTNTRPGAELLEFNDRASDSPFIERVWRSRSLRAGTFVSVASSHWEIVLTHHKGTITATLRGPETTHTPAVCPADAEWIGVRFKLGTYMPAIPVRRIIDRADLVLPSLNARSFGLNGKSWEFPDFDNAEVLVKRLVRSGVIARDRAVEATLSGEPTALSARSAQRHFVQATGMTLSAYRQIERARRATLLLKSGASILDTVNEAGYFDQAHLSRSLKALMGETPSKIARGERQLSFLYKTQPSRR